MKIVAAESKGVVRAFDITLTADDIAPKVESKIAEIAKNFKMPGFRPGKVPVSMIKQRAGSEVEGEVIRESIQQAIQKIMDENKIKPVVEPGLSLEEGDLKKGMKFRLTFELMPEMPALDYSQLEVVCYKCKPDAKDLATVKEKMKKNYQNLEPKDESYKAKTGDVVIMDLDIKSGEDKVAHEHNVPLELSEDSDDDAAQLAPQLYKKLIGHKKGEEVTLDLTLPENYTISYYSGKKATYTAKIKNVMVYEDAKEDVLAEIIKERGLKDEKELDESIMKQIETIGNDQGLMLSKEALFDQLMKQCEFDVPPTMVNYDFHQIMASVGDSIEKYGGNNEEKKQKEIQQYRDIAERRVKLGLVINHVANENNLKLTEEEIKAGFQKHFVNDPQAMAVLQSPRGKEYADRMYGVMIEEKAVDFILTKVKTISKELNFAAIKKLADEDVKKA
jgi:trigger factor